MNIERLIVLKETLIREAIRALNDTALGLVLVVNPSGVLIGVATDGDIRRGLLSGVSLDDGVGLIMNPHPVQVHRGNKAEARRLIEQKAILAVPVVDDEGKPVELVHWKDASVGIVRSYSFKQNLVFILAGGKGTRLKPFTNILPKPLIPLGDTPIIEVIMKRFQFYGFNQFVLSVNYRAEMIKSYFSESHEGFNIQYVQEKEYSGTAGSLSLLNPYHGETILVTNCDIIMDIDLDDFFRYHTQQSNHATIVGVVRHVKVPYGVMDLEGGELVGMREKPVYDFIVNAGVYAIEKEILELLPSGEFVDMPDLLWKAKSKGLRVGVYPISAEMIDVGHWDEYNLAVDKARKLGFIS